MQFEVNAYDTNGVCMKSQSFDDIAAADGMAAGWHVHYGWDVWVNKTQIFSSETPLQRLVPGVLND